jgi:hypothetical protein
MFTKIAIASSILILGVVAYAARQGGPEALPDLPADVFAPTPEDHMARANEHMRRAAAALAVCNEELRKAAEESALAAASGMNAEPPRGAPSPAPRPAGKPAPTPDEPEASPDSRTKAMRKVAKAVRTERS